MVMAADGSCQESTGQGARARHWPVHDHKTQSPAEATLLKLARLSENGLAAIGAVTPLAHAFLPRTLPGARQGSQGWPQGGGLASKQFPSFAASCPAFSSPSPSQSPVPPLTQTRVRCRQSTVGRPPKTSINLQPTSPVDLTKTTQQRSASRPQSCAFYFAPSFCLAQRRPFISARHTRGFS